MDRIGQEKKKSMLASISRWLFGVFFVLASVGSLVDSNIIAGLLFLLAAIIAIPPASTQLENKFNFKMSGIARFLVVFIILVFASSALPDTPVATNNTTAIAAPSSSVSGSNEIAVPASTATSEVTPTEATEAVMPDKKGTLDIVTSPKGASVKVDGISCGLTPVQGISLDEGKHTIDLYLSGYEAKTLTADITSADTKTIDWTFIPYVDTSTESTETPEVTETETAGSEPANEQVTTSSSSTTTASSSTNKNSATSSGNSRSTSTTTSNTINTDSSLIYASSESNVYHSAGCYYVDRIKPQYLITFNNQQEAKAAGYRACKKCGG